MDRYRIEKRLHGYSGEFYHPQYYVDKWFFGLFGGYYKDFYEVHVDRLGHYSEESVCFKDLKDAKAFIKMQEYKSTQIKYE